MHPRPQFHFFTLALLSSATGLPISLQHDEGRVAVCFAGQFRSFAKTVGSASDNLVSAFSNPDVFLFLNLQDSGKGGNGDHAEDIDQILETLIQFHINTTMKVTSTPLNPLCRRGQLVSGKSELRRVVISVGMAHSSGPFSNVGTWSRSMRMRTASDINILSVRDQTQISPHNLSKPFNSFQPLPSIQAQSTPGSGGGREVMLSLY
jgi:hypothetical protein